jgi:AcrR family transcriptional regulator
MNTSKNESKDRILEKATGEFAEHGFEGARMDRIADRAEVNKATIYYHYENKLELYQAVIIQPLDAIGSELETPPDSDDAADRLRHWMKFIVSRIRSHPGVAQLLLREIVDGGDRLSEDIRTIVQSVWGNFRKLLEECRTFESGSEYPLSNVQRSIVGSVLLNSLETPFFERMTGENTEADSIPDEQLVELILGGLIDS